MSWFVSVVTALVVFCAMPAQAQTYPAKPIHLLVPYAPGGIADIASRIVGAKLTEAWGQQVVVENKPGGNAFIAMTAAAKAAPDGYTLVECTIGTCAINPSIYAQTGYDLQKDFAPVFLVGGVMNIFTVHPSMSVKSIAELVAYIKANPGKLPVAIGAVGSSNHLTPVWFASIAGLDMLYVPFKGAGDAITALLGGQVMMFVDNEPSILPQIKSGKARPLAVTGPRRSAYLPDVATMEELGYKGFVVEPWYGFMVPQGSPRAAIERLNAAFNAAIRSPRIKARLEEAGLRLIGGAPERLGEQIRGESERWAKVVKANNVKVE